jgi:hypothetical protein
MGAVMISASRTAAGLTCRSSGVLPGGGLEATITLWWLEVSELEGRENSHCHSAGHQQYQA